MKKAHARARNSSSSPFKHTEFLTVFMTSSFPSTALWRHIQSPACTIALAFFTQFNSSSGDLHTFFISFLQRGLDEPRCLAFLCAKIVCIFIFISLQQLLFFYVVNKMGVVDIDCCEYNCERIRAAQPPRLSNSPNLDHQRQLGPRGSPHLGDEDDMV